MTKAYVEREERHNVKQNPISIIISEKGKKKNIESCLYRNLQSLRNSHTCRFFLESNVEQHLFLLLLAGDTAGRTKLE